MASLIEIREERLAKVAKLRELGINPYPARSKRTHKNKEISDKYDELEGKEVSVVGRLMSLREHGELLFADLQDGSGKVQLYINKTELESPPLELFDIGDFVEVAGVVTKTKRGEVSVAPKTLRMLTKSLRPLPEKHEGLKDVEERYRRRYVDLVMNPEVKELFERKARFWGAHRTFLKNKGFIELSTPVLETETGGADAKPFITHHNALDQDFYLRISPELALKRLIGGGYEKVYSLGPVFRNEGIDDEHLQEYYHLEWYWAYADYRDNMEMAKELFRYVASEIYGTTKFTKSEHTFDLADNWQEIDYIEVLKEKYGKGIFELDDKGLLELCKKEEIELDGPVNRNRMIDNLWKKVRKTISGPAFLINEPAFMSPLAKSKEGGDEEGLELTERFHVILAGSELGNAYSELNDPVDQFNRFKEQQAARDAGDDESQMMDVDYVEMLEYGMPPVSGYGHSERLFMFFENLSAREVTLFPQMRKKTTDIQKQLYDVDSLSGSRDKKQDFTKKVVIALRDDLEPWQVLNTAGHISAYMGNKMDADFGTGKNFTASDGTNYPRNSQYPIVLVKAKSKDLEKLREKAEAEQITHHAFIREMIETTNDADIVRILGGKKAEDVELLGVGVFGDNDKIEKLTKKLSLWK